MEISHQYVNPHQLTDESLVLNKFTQSAESPITNNQRPNIAMASMVITQRYVGLETFKNEALLFLLLFINLMNLWLNYDILVISNHTNFFWVSMGIEWTVSLYYSYHGFKSYKSRQDQFSRNQFSFIQLLNFLCGPFQLIVDVIYFINFGHLCWFSIFLRSFKPMTSDFQAPLIDDIKFSFVRTIPLFYSASIVFFIFTYFFTIFYSDTSQMFFKNIGKSSFTLLQIITFDGWGDITRHLYTQSNSSILIILFMFIFITIMAFFFNYLIQAFQIDVIILQESIKSNQCRIDGQALLIPQDFNLMRELLVDRYYKRMIILLAIIQFICAHFQDNLSHADDFTYILFNISIAVIYFIHYIILSTLDENYVSSVYDMEIYSRVQLIFHILAGPCAFSIIVLEYAYLNYIRYGPALLLFKLLTNDKIRDISIISKKVIPQSVAPYACMLGLTFLTAFSMSYFRTIHVEDWFDGYAYSVLTYFQVITLDDWAAGLAQNLIYREMYLACIFIFIFMVVTNYILIPAFVAQTCEIFSNILGASFTLRLKKESFNITFFSHKFKNSIANNDQDFEIDYYKYTLNQHVKAVIVKLLQNKSALFGTKEPPQLLKDMFKQILKRERKIKHKFPNLSSDEVNLVEVLEKIEKNDKEKEIYIKYKDQIIHIDETNYKYLSRNVKMLNGKQMI